MGGVETRVCFGWGGVGVDVCVGWGGYIGCK